MDKSEVSRPIIIILDSLNYIPWSQAMFSFLKGRKLWRYVTGDIQAPTQGATETPTEFIVRLEEWDSKNHQIITWIRNTSIPSISLQFGRFDTAHAIWDFLATRYTTADLACQYQLMTSLCRQRQEPGQSISAFLPQIYSIWDQLTSSEPKWLCAASLLHRIPLPTLEQAISELLSEETRLGLVLTFHVATALATPGSRGRGSSGGSRSFSASSSQSSGGSVSRPNECTFCHAADHRLLTCPIRVCKTCRQRGPGHYRSDCPNNPTRRDTRPQSTAATAGVSSTASASPTLSMSVIFLLWFSRLCQPPLSSSSTHPYLTDPSIDLFPDDADVPADSPDDTLHVAPPSIVYPVESSSTDPAPLVLPPVPLPSDIPICRSTLVREVPSYLRDYHCFSIVLAQYEPLAASYD
ncbi:histone acetyltransferase of the CBP family 12 [Actinidia rufa]|uniref:Histone acetyltransferase of the CBP family 12 n=1 Tax=Actinidia rufa TaxID=165716 RepID=A0A7J0FCV4_9ERIC|nr:histone acetyltransferase of the CBP family 12 [Actinidia rufa]